MSVFYYFKINSDHLNGKRPVLQENRHRSTRDGHSGNARISVDVKRVTSSVRFCRPTCGRLSTLRQAMIIIITSHASSVEMCTHNRLVITLSSPHSARVDAHHFITPVCSWKHATGGVVLYLLASVGWEDPQLPIPVENAVFLARFNKNTAATSISSR